MQRVHQCQQHTPAGTSWRDGLTSTSFHHHKIAAIHLSIPININDRPLFDFPTPFPFDGGFGLALMRVRGLEMVVFKANQSRWCMNLDWTDEDGMFGRIGGDGTESLSTRPDSAVVGRFLLPLPATGFEAGVGVVGLGLVDPESSSKSSSSPPPVLSGSLCIEPRAEGYDARLPELRVAVSDGGHNARSNLRRTPSNAKSILSMVLRQSVTTSTMSLWSSGMRSGSASRDTLSSFIIVRFKGSSSEYRSPSESLASDISVLMRAAGGTMCERKVPLEFERQFSMMALYEAKRRPLDDGIIR